MWLMTTLYVAQIPLLFFTILFLSMLSHLRVFALPSLLPLVHFLDTYMSHAFSSLGLLFKYCFIREGVPGPV